MNNNNIIELLKCDLYLLTFFENVTLAIVYSYLTTVLNFNFPV